MADLIALADKLAPGSYAVILLLLLIIGGLLRRVVHIPDDNYVPREQYDAVVKSEAEWKNLALTQTPVIKEQADHMKALTEINEKLVERLGRPR